MESGGRKEQPPSLSSKEQQTEKLKSLEADAEGYVSFAVVCNKIYGLQVSLMKDFIAGRRASDGFGRNGTGWSRPPLGEGLRFKHAASQGLAEIKVHKDDVLAFFERYQELG